jgi:hypothetical protein
MFLENDSVVVIGGPHWMDESAVTIDKINIKTGQIIERIPAKDSNGVFVRYLRMKQGTRGYYLFINTLYPKDSDNINIPSGYLPFNDSYLLYITPHGDTIVSKQLFRCKGYELINSVVQKPDGFVVAGFSSKNDTIPKFEPYIAKIDTNGNVLWRKFYKQPPGFAGFCKIIPTETGGYIAVGYCQVPSYNKCYYVKVDDNGNEIWRKVWNGTYDNVLWDIIPVNPNKYALIGEKTEYDPLLNQLQKQGLILFIDSNGTALSYKTNGEHDQYETYQGCYFDGKHFYPTGFSYKPSRGAIATISKLNLQGNEVWRRELYHHITGRYSDFRKCILLPNGQLLIGGSAIDTSLTIYKNQQCTWLVLTDTLGCLPHIPCISVSTQEEAPPQTYTPITLYPNPATTVLYPSAAIATLHLYTTMGSKVYQYTTPTPADAPIPLPQLPSGMYLYTITTPQNTQQRGKFIINH